ncbi:hypothetical protein ACJIZ3_013369 [Penstemon smallii]|uniref:Uncharacterized protein n=1 Tax=Penstemon smallii TaxID=265156 RepID=A0ABD3UQR1_9LAMI
MNCEPDQKLLALDTCHLLHPTVLDERRDLPVVPNPHESGFLVVADFEDVVQREEAFGEENTIYM